MRTQNKRFFVLEKQLEMCCFVFFVFDFFFSFLLFLAFLFV